MDIENEILNLKEEIKDLKKEIENLKEKLRVETCRRMNIDPYEEKKPYDLSSIKRSRKKYK